MSAKKDTKKMIERNAIALVPELFDKVLSGDKVSTFRKGIRAYRTGPALVVEDGGQGRVVHIEIIDIGIDRFGSFTPDELGYKSQEDVIDALKSFYPDTDINDHFTLVRFKIA